MRAVWAMGILIVLMAFLPVSPGRAQAQDSDYLIVPGQRVGRWELGKPLDAYGLGQARSRWEGRADGTAYYDGHTFLVPPGATRVEFYTCKNNGAVFAIFPTRRVDVTPQAEAEEAKYRTAQGVGIGTEETELQRLLGRPEWTNEYSQRHGQVEVMVRQYGFPGLRILVNRSDSKVFSIGATTPGGFGACLDAVLGKVPVTVSLTVPVPGDLRITLPSSSVPANRAAFSGVWVGKWDNILDTALVVQEFTTLGISGIYAWGVAPPWNIHRAGWTRVTGRFAGPDELHVQAGVLVVYQMRPDGRLDGVFGGQARTVLTKVFPK